jgi:hypothetical protein
MDEKDVLEVLTTTFHTDRLCPKCNGPMEATREIDCWKCNLKAHMRTKLAVMEDTIMTIGNDVGVRPNNERPFIVIQEGTLTKATVQKIKKEITEPKKKKKPKK